MNIDCTLLKKLILPNFIGSTYKRWIFKYIHSNKSSFCNHNDSEWTSKWRRTSQRNNVHSRVAGSGIHFLFLDVSLIMQVVVSFSNCSWNLPFYCWVQLGRVKCINFFYINIFFVELTLTMNDLLCEVIKICTLFPKRAKNMIEINPP